ncbi:hypothetical protein [Nostoc punctiforme]|uniref:DUF2190 family protein n=2 Tax=Nostoc punctiforme TaxID=272131 RepID=B2ITA7_NOSP7|nr:hypothetical protein [Nostoc punctiforme]ACC81138.1 hypothetical protein Npun_R2584 [Nostoc punctiforme PCC 73102]RCJ29185.1 hypothetical protein A6769_35920 [Nostoc punctiforme NIES-2108]
MAISYQAQSTVAGVQRAPGYLTVTTAGSIAAGAKSVFIYNAGTKNGIVLGANIVPGQGLSWETTGNDTIGAIAYDPTKDAAATATGTTFWISSLS